jgi:hypothetical protein
MPAESKGRISVKNEELLSPRDFRREFTTKLRELNAGDVEKLVLSKRGQFVGVVITIDAYEDLLLHQMRPGLAGVEIDAYADSDD